MTGNVATVDVNAPVSEAARIMRDLNVGSIPVCQGEKPVGIITDRDITIRNAANKGIPEQTPVNQVMTSKVISGRPDMTTHEAATLMADNQIRRLPIMENGSIVGMVSLGDLAVQSRSDMEAGRALSTISIPSQPKR